MPAASFVLDSPVGLLTLVASEHGVQRLHFGRADVGTPSSPNHPLLTETAEQLAAYFAGTRTTFEVPLDLDGTPFQQQVWALLQTLPYGTTTTYGALAERLCDPGKARAVGLANGKNPVGIIVPCHRVIGASGALTGFAGGLEVKAWLLQHERRHHPEAAGETGQRDLFARA